MVLGFEDYLTETQNIYDLVGNCFGLLCKKIKNHQAFIGEYMSEGEGAVNNPNLERLQQFSQKIMDALREYKPSAYEYVRDNIVRAVECLELEKYLDEEKNRLTVIYGILAAVDASAMEWKMHWMQATLGPLDLHGKTGYRVYFSPRDTVHTQFVDGVKRKRVGPSNFFECFSSFRFVDADKWKENIEVPEVKLMRIPHQMAKKFHDEGKLKIAVIPAPRQRNFRFVPEKGSGVRVEYFPEQQESGNICSSVENVIRQGAHIVVLPEYETSPAIYESLGKRLRELKCELRCSSDFLLLFAGSTWTEDNNNVMRILDAEGNPLGEYYKYSPYSDWDEENHCFRQYEALAEPGKRCDLIAVEGVGMILPAICRDAIDGEYTEELAGMLLPVLVVIAAWSPSVASFEPRQQEYASKYFVSTVMCNACSAVDVKKDKIGNGSIVTKTGTIAGCELKPILRKDCDDNCENGTCAYFLEYDFAFEEKVGKPNVQCHKYCEK